MISDRLYNSIGLYIHVASRLGVIPFDWCAKRQLVVRCQRANILTHINFISICVSTVVIVFQLIRYYLTNNSDNFSIVLTTGIGPFLSLQVMILLTYFQDDFIFVMNAVFHYLKYMNRKYNNLLQLNSLKHSVEVGLHCETLSKRSNGLSVN